MREQTCGTGNKCGSCWLEAGAQSDRQWSRRAVWSLSFGMLFGLSAEPAATKQEDCEGLLDLQLRADVMVLFSFQT